jgi:hypothetical protein
MNEKQYSINPDLLIINTNEISCSSVSLFFVHVDNLLCLLDKKEHESRVLCMLCRGF